MVDTIELLNEAAGFIPNWPDAIRQFWLDGYDAVRSVEPSANGSASTTNNDSSNNRTNPGTLAVMIGDAFLGLPSWTGFLTPPRGHNVLIDLHSYQIFSDLELNRTFNDHISYACSTTFPAVTSFASSNVWTVVGEWSAALTDCAKWLNGRGIGSRWDKTWYPDTNPTSFFHGSCDGWTGSWNGKDGGKGFTDEYKDMLRKYWEVQVEIGEAAQGWVYWTWKVRISPL